MKKIVFSTATGLVIAGTAVTSASAADKVEVVNGDTLWSIANNNSTSVQALKEVNNLDSNMIYPGQTLKVEGEAVQDVHMVTYGDTLYSIAHDNNISVDQLKSWNSLSSNMIYPGDELALNAPAKPAAKPAKAEKKEEKSSSDSVHTVKSGDTLYSIAQANGIAVDDLKTWNALSSNLIYPGQHLVLYPTQEPKVVPEPVAEKAPEPEVVKEAQTAPAPEVQPEATQGASAEAAAVAESPTPAQAPEPETQSPEGATLTVSATAYTAECYGCSGITATGVNLNNNRNAKVIAVDPDVIPLGTKVYVEGYGEAIAADTGGAINGNKIDLHVPTRSEALDWGVRTVEVTILD